MFAKRQVVRGDRCEARGVKTDERQERRLPASRTSSSVDSKQELVVWAMRNGLVDDVADD